MLVEYFSANRSAVLDCRYTANNSDKKSFVKLGRPFNLHPPFLHSCEDN